MKNLKMDSHGISFAVSVTEDGDICLEVEGECYYLSPEDAKVLGVAITSIVEGEKDD